MREQRSNPNIISIRFVNLARDIKWFLEREEMEAEGHQSLLTNRILEELIRFYGDKVVAMIGPYLEQQILQSLAAQDRIREQWTKAFAQPYPTPDQVIRQMVEQYQELTGQGQPAAEPESDAPEPDEDPENKTGEDK